jgi:hypothetical protein
MTDAESYEGPMKRLSEKSRAAKWSNLFGRTLSTYQIKDAVARQTVFADQTIAGLSEPIGLLDGQSQINYQDVLDEEEKITAQLSSISKRNPKRCPIFRPGKFDWSIISITIIAGCAPSIRQAGRSRLAASDWRRG